MTVVVFILLHSVPNCLSTNKLTHSRHTMTKIYSTNSKFDSKRQIFRRYRGK